MNAMVATVALAAIEFPLPQWYGATHGAMRECDTDQAITGACTSGRNKDCAGKTSHRIRCQAGENLFADKVTHPWIEKKYGDWAICPAGSIAVSRCGSGKNEDCKVVNNKGWHHALRCRTLLANWRVLESGHRWLCGAAGEDVSCPVGYVVTESCGSGKNNDCDNRGCGGRQAWSGLKCNRLVDDSDVKLSSESPAGTVEVRAADGNDNVQSLLPGQPVCQLDYRLTLGEETLSFGSEYQTEEGFEVTTTASSSQKLSVQQKWTSSIGASKGPFTGTFGSETTFAGEWTTSSQIVEISTIHNVTKGSVQRTMTLPANAYVALASFVVLTTLTASVSADLTRVAFTDTYIDKAEADYRHVSPAAYNLVVDLVDHPNLIGIFGCEAFVTELFTSGTIKELNADLHRL